MLYASIYGMSISVPLQLAQVLNQLEITLFAWTIKHSWHIVDTPDYSTLEQLKKTTFWHIVDTPDYGNTPLRTHLKMTQEVQNRNLLCQKKKIIKLMYFLFHHEYSLHTWTDLRSLWHENWLCRLCHENWLSHQVRWHTRPDYVYAIENVQSERIPKINNPGPIYLKKKEL